MRYHRTTAFNPCSIIVVDSSAVTDIPNDFNTRGPSDSHQDPILWSIGIVVLIIGLVLFALGAMGRAGCDPSRCDVRWNLSRHGGANSS